MPTSQGLAPNDLDSVTRILHAGITGLAILAWLSGQWAGDYKRLSHPWFTIHSWIGISLCLFMIMRIIYGLIGPKEAQFKAWVPYNKERLLFVLEDILALLRLQLPHRPSHQGLPGLVQSVGLGIFAWMTLTGSLMFFYLQPGHKARGVMYLVKEMHELGQWLIIIFLGLHLTGVLLDALFGQEKWRKMFFLEK